ncbi:MAG: hypothetical protein O7H41_16385 [Planctomycetota bacterium]|nr:hypothetical protein [Planctomycetota bacterium]
MIREHIAEDSVELIHAAGFLDGITAKLLTELGEGSPLRSCRWGRRELGGEGSVLRSTAPNYLEQFTAHLPIQGDQDLVYDHPTISSRIEGDEDKVSGMRMGGTVPAMSA